MSGGQTGVDRAALDAARDCGLEIGGWCPRGRKAEDGRIPEEYPLKETASASYPVRTEQNVVDSDGTLILVRNRVKGGTRLTKVLAAQHNRPCLVLKLQTAPTLLAESPEEQWALMHGELQKWVEQHRISILNIAGPRGSSAADMYDLSHQFLTKFFQQLP